MDEVEYAARVELLLAKWQRFYEESGVPSASPLLDRIMAEKQVADEMVAEE